MDTMLQKPKDARFITTLSSESRIRVSIYNPQVETVSVDLYALRIVLHGGVI